MALDFNNEKSLIIRESSGYLNFDELSNTITCKEVDEYLSFFDTSTSLMIHVGDHSISIPEYGIHLDFIDILGFCIGGNT